MMLYFFPHRASWFYTCPTTRPTPARRFVQTAKTHEYRQSYVKEARAHHVKHAPCGAKWRINIIHPCWNSKNRIKGKRHVKYHYEKPFQAVQEGVSIWYEMDSMISYYAVPQGWCCLAPAVACLLYSCASMEAKTRWPVQVNEFQ